MGRPREYDRAHVATTLLEWVKQDGNLNLCGFCADYGIAPSLVLKWKSEPDFCATYEEAKAHLGKKREKALNAGALHVKAYDLNAATYDPFLKEERRDQATFESLLKQQETEKVSEEQKSKQEAMLVKLDKLLDQK